MQAGEFLVLPAGTEMTWARAPADTPLWLTHGPTPFWLFLPWGQRLGDAQESGGWGGPGREGQGPPYTQAGLGSPRGGGGI